MKNTEQILFRLLDAENPEEIVNILLPDILENDDTFIQYIVHLWMQNMPIERQRENRSLLLKVRNKFKF